MSPNRGACTPGFGLPKVISRVSGTALERPVREGENPVRENPREAAVSRVPRDTRNLVGMSGDHSVRLNTP